MRIILTKEELDANYYSTDDCAIARNLKKILPGRSISVGGYSVSIDDSEYNMFTLNKSTLGFGIVDLKNMRSGVLEPIIEIVGLEELL